MTDWSRRCLAGICALVLSSCGCAGSRDRPRGDPAASAGAALQVSAFHARFSLPDGWSGGENDAGGLEYTDGELALMVGRAPSSGAPSLEAFLDSRVAALAEQGTLGGTRRSDSERGGKRLLQFSATVASASGPGLEVRLLVAEPTESERLSLLMVGEASWAAELSAAWDFLVQSLRFE